MSLKNNVEGTFQQRFSNMSVRKVTVPLLREKYQLPGCSWLLLAAVIFSGTRPVLSQQALLRPVDVYRGFVSPEKSYRPLVRWWWPGNAVDPAELRRELEVLDRAGFGGVEIQPFHIGLPDLPTAVLKRVNDYPTADFFRNVAAAARAARDRGMYVDYTFGSGWPFGGGEITPELASVELRWSHLSVQGPETMHTRLELPGIYDGDPQTAATVTKGLPEGWAKRLQDRVKLVAVLAARGPDALWYMSQTPGVEQPVLKTGVLDSDSVVNLTDHLEADGTLNWNVPPGTWQVFVFRSAPTVHRVLGGVGNGPQLEMDHWNRAAFAAHARAVGDNAVPYLGEYFGNGVRAAFCDSLEIMQHFYWSDDFLEQFHKRRGYDLTPYLPILKVQGYGGPFGNFDNAPAYDMSGIGDAVRRDYWKTVSDLMMERFFDPFEQWSHAHHLLARVQAHGAPADVLRIYGSADIPETEDLYDNGRYEFLKEASSSAHVFGRRIVGSESFVWQRKLYQTTPEEMKRAADELLTVGVNAILYHGFAYQLPGQSAPGWHPFVGAPGENSYSSQFNEDNPFFPYFAQFNRYLTRVQYISQAGESISQVAIYRYELQHGAKELPPSAPSLRQQVMDAGYNYDDINTDSLKQCIVKHHKLITTGGAQYSVLVLPELHAIDVDLAEKLWQFAKDGLPIFFAGALPSREDGLLDNAARSLRVKAAMHSLTGMPNVHRATGAAYVVAAVQRVAAPDVRFHGAALPYFERRIGGMTAFFFRNAQDQPAHVVADFAAAGQPELWDAWNGSSRAIVDSHRHDDRIEVSFDLKPIGSALIVFTPEPTATIPVDPVRHIVAELPIGAGGWKLTATGMVPSGRTETFTRSLNHLLNWTFDDDLKGLSGRGTYTTTFTAPPIKQGTHMVLNLGEVGDVAEVRVNGADAGTRLFRPYTLDITSLLHEGTNTLQVTVTDALYNAMVLRKPRGFGAGSTSTPSGLLPAGLIGPVEIDIMK